MTTYVSSTGVTLYVYNADAATTGATCSKTAIAAYSSLSLKNARRLQLTIRFHAFSQSAAGAAYVIGRAVIFPTPSGGTGAGPIFTAAELMDAPSGVSFYPCTALKGDIAAGRPRYVSPPIVGQGYIGNSGWNWNFPNLDIDIPNPCYGVSDKMTIEFNSFGTGVASVTLRGIVSVEAIAA